MKVDILLYLLGILVFFIAVGYSVYIYNTDPYFFCITAKGEVDVEDEGERCFKTRAEVKEYADYITDKYSEEPIDWIGNLNMSVDT